MNFIIQFQSSDIYCSLFFRFKIEFIKNKNIFVSNCIICIRTHFSTKKHSVNIYYDIIQNFRSVYKSNLSFKFLL